MSEYTSNLSVSNKRRYLDKIRGVGDPYLIPTNELQIDVLPPVQCTDIFNYLVLGKRFCTSQRFKAFRSLDAYKYFESGFVNCLGSKAVGKKFVTVAKVYIYIS